MEIKNIRTREDFIQWLRESQIEVEEADIERVADWFVAVVNARMIFDAFTTKNIAHMFLDGVKGIKEDPEAAHKEFWNSFFEDVDYIRNGNSLGLSDADELERDAVSNIVDLLEYHFHIVRIR